MARFLHHIFSGLQRKAATVILAFCFLTGLLFGLLLFREAQFSVALMRGALDGTVSIVRLLSVILLPFLFSAFAVYFSKPRALYLIAFLKAMTFAFVSAGVRLSFGSAGWLAQGLMMFSDCLTLPLLWLYWAQNVSAGRGFQLKELLSFAGCACLIGCLDYFIIVPFLTVI